MTEPLPSDRWYDRPRVNLLIVLAAMALLGSIAGYRLAHVAMWGDEVRTWRDSVGKSYELILTWHHNADHAPLGHLLAKASADLFHTDAPWALRLPALLFGLAIVPLGYLLGRLAWDRLAGVLIAVMTCVDVTVITQAHSARMYTQFLAWLLAATCVGVALLRSPRRRWLKVALLGLTLALALWTHYAAMMLLLATLISGIVFLFRREDRRAGIDLLIACAVAALLSIQGLIKLFGMAGRDKLPVANDHNSIEQLLEACADLIGNAPLAIILFGFAVFGIVLFLRRNRRGAVWLLIGVTFGVGNLLIASMYRQIEGSRYLLGFLPAMWLGLGVANASLFRDPRPGLRRTIIVLFIAGVGYQFFRTLDTGPHPQAAPMRTVGHTIRTLGYTNDQTLLIVPQNPQQMGAKYYGLEDDDTTYRRLMTAMHLPEVSPATLGRYRPPVLWMIVVTPCRTSQQNTPDDAIAAVRTAALFYGQTLDESKLPHDTDNRQMSIVRLTPTTMQIWRPDGTPR